MSRFQTGSTIERYHPTDDFIHARRVAVVNWLEAAAQAGAPGNRADLDRLLTEAHAGAMIVDTVHPIEWDPTPFTGQGGTAEYPAIPGAQYSVPYNNKGGRMRASTYVRQYWRNIASDTSVARGQLRAATAVASGASRLRTAATRANSRVHDVLYIADVIIRNAAIAPAPFGPNGDWHTYAQIPDLRHNKYPGQWDGRPGGGGSYVTMRHAHVQTDQISRIYPLLVPTTPNGPIPADCLEMVAILCKTEEDRKHGEAYCLHYAAEINALNEENGRPHPFLWTEPERGFNISFADQRAARRLAEQHYRAGNLDGLMYEMVPAGTPRHPPRWATYEELKQLPYNVRPKDVKLRWIAGSRPGECPHHNDWNPVDAVALWGPPPP